MSSHAHEYERGVHMSEAFGIGGRIWACAICGTPKPDGDDAERVLRLLTNASVTQADMAFVLGLSIRAVQAACEELRRTGYPVLSSGDGMRLGTAEEALTCAAALRKRAITQLVTSRALRRTARRMRTAKDAAASLTLWPKVAA